MSIVAVRAHRISSPLHTPFVTALRRATTADSLIVEVVDGDGNSGFGEAPQVWAVTGANIPGSQACVEEMIAPKLIGKDADDLNARCREVARAVVGNEAARAAVDVALHDLAARRLGIPLYRLLGATSHVVPTDVTLAAGEPGEIAAAAEARLSEGFTTLKLKVGTDASTDLDRIKAACGVEGAQIRLDANQGWTAREAIRIINGISAAGLPVELVEQPVHRADLAGLAEVTRNVDIPIMADESVFSIRDLVEVITRRAADLVNIKLAKCGGLSIARVMLDLAETHGLGTCVGSMMEGPVGLGAAASLVAAYPTTVLSDLDAAWWLASSPVRGGLTYENGTVVLPSTSGLGLEV
ncbi:mandelate racemase/muconate lactonizing enzyme family protein [Catelliglobosispora koreensis]|uniref:mandelate racemase/muconate lactonizing enzyme family protein n=1 Tax=Catelliglobosispora koreensis TaxID=129052 RepID=UPI00036289ED|nr:dipeptide epimerase [Catelliglobosispora koreensis]